MGLKSSGKRAIVHAGIPKTGTTTIQSACFEARQTLHLKGDVLYPGKWPVDQLHLQPAFMSDTRAYAERFRGHSDVNRLRRESDKLLAAFEAEIRKSRATTVLLSCEGFYNLDRAALARLRDWLFSMVDEVEVFFVTREPVSLATSVVQQVVKLGEVLDDVYARYPRPSFRTNLGGAIEIFGRDAIKVLTLESMARHHEGIVGAFLDHVGVTSETARNAVLQAEERHNVSLTNEAVQILSSLNRQLPLLSNGRSNPQRAIAEEERFLRQLNGAKYRLPREVAERVFSMSRDEVAWLEETFGISEYDVFDETSCSSEPPLDPEFVDSLALTLSDLIKSQGAVSSKQGFESLRRRGMRFLGLWARANLPGMRRWS